MTANPTCCTPDETVTRIAKLMKTENVGAIPICESRDSKKLIGIVTDRDLAIKVVAAGKDPHSVKASDVMTRNPITCQPGDDLQVALESMERRQIRRLLVADSAGLLVGIIAQADVARRLQQPEKTAEFVAQVSKPSTIGAA